MSLHNAGRLTGVPDLLAYLALLKSQHWIQSAMSSHRHTPKSIVTAMVLALFMLLNAVVVVGEEADRVARLQYTNHCIVQKYKE